jgi:hypothetical protein
MGASGIYSLVMVIATNLVPRVNYAKYMAIMSTVFAVASVVGPILGGAISTHSTWRWVFLLKCAKLLHAVSFLISELQYADMGHSAPAGALSIVLVALFLPSSIASQDVKLVSHIRAKFTMSTLRRVDVLGVVLLLGSSVLLVFALEEAGTRYPWKSGVILYTIILAGLLGVCFIFWELSVQRFSSSQEPLFRPTILTGRLAAAMMT